MRKLVVGKKHKKIRLTRESINYYPYIVTPFLHLWSAIKSIEYITVFTILLKTICHDGYYWRFCFFCIFQKWYDDCVSCLGDMFNVSLLKLMTFNLLCLGTIFLFTWFIVPYFYLAEHMVQEGYTEDDGAAMLSLIGITNTIGMVSLIYNPINIR